MNKNGISWKKCMDVCTDRVKTMKLLCCELKKENSECSHSYCSHLLASKGMPSDFSSVLYDVIKLSFLSNQDS